MRYSLVSPPTIRLCSIRAMTSVTWAARCKGRSLLQPLVRPVAVVVPRVLVQDLPQVLLSEDQQVVETFAAQRACEPFRECVRPRGSGRGFDHSRPVPGEDLVECCCELAVPVAEQELEPASSLAEAQEQVTGLLGRPRARGMGGHAQDVPSPGLDLHHEQDVHAPQQDGIHVQEIARRDAGRRGGQELPPRRRRPARSWLEPGGGQDPADRPLPHPVPQAEQLTPDAPVAPARVLPGQLLHQVADLVWDRRSSDGVRVRPLSPGQAPVPSQQRIRGHDPVQPQAPGQQPRQGGHHGTVSPVRPRAGGLPPQDRDLMPEHQDLRILAGVTSRQEHQPAEHPDHEQVDETDEHQRRA